MAKKTKRVLTESEEYKGMKYWMPSGEDETCWCPSTEIEAAWEVAEKLRLSRGGHLTLLAFTTNWRAGWITPKQNYVFEQYGFKEFIEAPTAPLAICRAALKAMEVNG